MQIFFYFFHFNLLAGGLGGWVGGPPQYTYILDLTFWDLGLRLGLDWEVEFGLRLVDKKVSYIFQRNRLCLDNCQTEGQTLSLVFQY